MKHFIMEFVRKGRREYYLFYEENKESAECRASEFAKINGIKQYYIKQS